MIPECVLVLHWTKTDQPPTTLLHRIPLLGAREDYFMLQIENSGTTMEKCACSVVFTYRQVILRIVYSLH